MAMNARMAFPADEAVIQSTDLVMPERSKKRRQHIRDWGMILQQIVFTFENSLNYQAFYFLVYTHRGIVLIFHFQLNNYV